MRQNDFIVFVPYYARLRAIFWRFLVSMIFENFGPKPECPSDFRSFGKNFTWYNMLQSWASKSLE